MSRLDIFKDAFKEWKRKKAEKKNEADELTYERRRGKTIAALQKVHLAIQGLEDLGGDVDDSNDEYEDLRNRLLQVHNNAEGNYKNAYKQLDDIKKAAYKLQTAVTKAYKTAIDDPKARVKTDVNGEEVELHPRAVPGFEEMTRAQRQEALQAIGGKILKGKVLVDELNLDPDGMDDPEREDVANMMWYLKATAEKKAGPFAKGTLTVPDKGYKIRGYLDRCTEVYNRKSTHMTDHQKKEGGIARGIDFYEGGGGCFDEDGDFDEDKAKLMMPYGMNTLLVQSFTVENGEERMMLKMETESARFGEDKQFKGREDFDTLPQSRPKTDEDGARARAHLWNAVKAKVFKKHDNGGLVAFREDLESGKAKQVVDAYTKAVEYAKKNCPLVYKYLKAGDWKTNINVMCANIESLGSIPDRNFDGDDKLRDLLLAAANVIDEMNAFGNFESRVGNEVVLSSDDL